MKLNKLRHNKWFHRAYYVGIAVKGFDGLVELVAGIALLISPVILHHSLMTVMHHANNYHGILADKFAEYVGRLDEDLARAGLMFLIIFLIGHGIVKLTLVYCLLRRIIWAYPYALGVLWLFLIYQLYVTFQDPGSLGLWFFTVLDALIIWLVWGEWKDLQEEAADKKPASKRRDHGKTDDAD
jgi:uncharacterized membrane protein